MIKGCEGLTIDTGLFKIDDWRLAEFGGNVYEGVRRTWFVAKGHYADLKYAVVVKRGENIVIGVFNIEGWEKSDENPKKVMFKGSRNLELEKLWVGKRINKCYRKQGLQGGRVYASSENLLEEVA